jgi:putative endonuclease
MNNVGLSGENTAREFLISKGLSFVEGRFHTRWGEIDLIFRDKDCWVFVEVKTRQSLHNPAAVDAITPAKQKRLINAALMFMKRRALEGQAMRFDVVLIEAGKIEWLRDAFQGSSWFTF